MLLAADPREVPVASGSQGLARDAAASYFADVYEEYFPFVWRSARGLGAPDDLIDDAVQEIFIVVHRRLPEFAGRSSMKTWIFGIVVNVVRAFRRTMRARQTRTLDASCGGDPNEVLDWRPQPDEALTKVEAARVVDRLLESLDDDKRAVFVLAELEELPAPEIAEALSIPLNTVYSRLRLARQEFAVASARHRARDGWRFR